MSRQYLSWFCSFFTLLELVVETHLTIYDGGLAFIPNSHDRYTMQDISSIHEELSSDISSSFHNIKLRFDPEFLDFKQRPLGVPHVERVRLINTDRNRSIDMTSISGSTVHFHSSFFENKKIPPLGNTTFNVVFLGREEGSIESSLYIHTTEGHLKYRVKGASIYSPYRLRPIVGVKLPINTSFSPLIYMHNPHTEPIQIVEIYSSGGDFHLELPSGELEGPKDLWEIPPLETKAIIRVRFHARAEQNHTAYVRIKLNNTEEILVVPLEVEVTSTACMFYPQGSVDFGVGGSLDPVKKLKLFLQNPTRQQLKILSITSSSKAIRIDYDQVRSEGKHSKSGEGILEVATLTLDWKTAFDAKDFSGKITIKYQNGKAKTEIPYYVTVVAGGLSINSSVTKYFVKEKTDRLSVRKIDVRNDFLTPVMLINVALAKEAQNYFEISEFKSIVLQPKEEKSIFILKLKQNVLISELKLNSHILLKTNISEVEFPLLTYNGQLETHLPFKSKDNSLDLGLISFESIKEVYVLLLNKNPVSVTVKQISTSLPLCTIGIVDCGRGDPVNALLKESFRNSTKCVRLKPNDYVIVRLLVETSNAEGQVWGDISLNTQYEQLSIPVHFKVAQGRLEIEPETPEFDQCFPGKICTHPLRVHSTFNDPMVIEDLLSVPPDPRITSKHSGHIMAKAAKVIGHLYLDPNLECLGECYLGIVQENIDKWFTTLTLPKATTEFDINLVNTFYNRYLNFSSNKHHKWQNITMRLDTSEVKGHMFTSRVKMSWPSLVSDSDTVTRSIFQFPLTQVGNISYQNLTIRNPSTLDLIVQLVMDNVYPNAEVLKDALSYDFFLGVSSTSKRNKVFFLSESYVEAGETFSKILHLDVDKNTFPIFLKPGENITVTIGYSTSEASSDTAFIFIRNNLTVIEVVHLRAQGAHPSFKFGNRKPGAMQPLQFELTDKHLKDCEKENNRRYLSQLSIKRTFTARNTGDIVIYINDFFINGLSCEGYGFKVLNCEPFALHPNSTRKIDIEFTPDFTLARISRTLVLETSLNQNVNYTLIATVPHIYLNLCPNIIARPSWELCLYYFSAVIMAVTLFAVCVAAVLESERVLKLTLYVISRHSPSTQPTLDLRLIGAQTRAEIRNPKTDVEEQKLKTDKTEKAKIPEDSKNVVSEEKYNSLIPTIGRTKKKVAKTKSNEILSEINEHKKDRIDKNRKNDIKNIHKPDKKNLKEKRVHNKKEAKQSEFSTPCEEETSSTTTESSCANDDVEKSQTKVPLKKTISRNEVNCVKNDLIIKDDTISKNDEDIIHMKAERKKSAPRQTNRRETKETTQENKADVIHNTHKENKSKLNKNLRERKEKPFTKKTNGRNANKSSLENINVMYNTRVSPSIQSVNVWTENKASFSDVVARNDSVSVNSPSSTQSSNPVLNHTLENPPQKSLQSKPIMYVEPYSKTNVELGPIGSRKDFWQENGSPNNIFQADNHLPQPQNNSFFSEGTNLDINFFTPSSNDLQYSPPDPWASTISTNTSTNYWDGILSNSRLNVRDPPTTQPRTPPDNTCWSSWGSPVWQPLATEVTRTPTRTPPGFAPHREVQERSPQHQLQQPQEQENVYGPFSLNIWSNQQQNPWNYPPRDG